MRRLFQIGLALTLVFATIGAAAYGPQLASSAQDFYTRMQVLERMLQIIQVHYVEEVNVDDVFDNAIDGVLENLDPHSRYYTAEEYEQLQEQYRGDYAGIGVSFELFDGVITVIDALEGGPSKSLGLQPGDQIVAINGSDATGLGRDYDEVYERLRGPQGTHVDVSVRRPGVDEFLDYTIVRGRVDISALSVATMVTPKTGYVRLNTFSRKAADQLEEALDDLEQQGMENFILDLRGNGGGLMDQAIRITDKFLSSGKTILRTRGRSPNSNMEQPSTDRSTHPRVPMVVLVNRGSASASEIVSGALQDWDRALIAGETTFGKALVQNQFQFDDGSALFLTIARYYTPSGRLIQREYEGKERDEYYAEAGTDGPDEVGPIEETATLEQLDTPEDDSSWPGNEEDRPVYHTAGGRVVYGGGGIHPDVELEATRVSGLAAAFYRRPLRLYFRFAMDWTAAHAAEIPIRFEDYARDFRVDDALVEEFVGYLRSEEIRPLLDDAGIPLDDESLQEAWEDMRVYLRSDIAALVWGQNAAGTVLLEYDGQVDSAIDLFPQAADLLTLTEQAPAGDAPGEEAPETDSSR